MPSLVRGKQIVDASITAAKLAVDFLATVLRADGSVAWTGPQNAGSQRITNLGAPQTESDAARLADIFSIPWKDKVVAATTGNIALTGLQTVDGIALTSGQRALVRMQTNKPDNGIYLVGAGAWVRAADADSAGELRGAVVTVEQGTTNADKRFAQTSDNIVLGTTDIVWVDIGTGTPAGFPATTNKDMAASNTSADFQQACATTLAGTPANDSYVRVFVNGIAVSVGDGVKTKASYFSADGGSTAKTIANIAAGDTLWWVGSVAGYQLATTDVIDVDYLV